MKEKAMILVVDDSTMDIQMLVSILKNDYIIKIAKNGMNALDLIYQGLQPNLILLDVMMPVMDGYKFIQKLNECSVCFYCPVIFITGSSNLEDEEKAFSLGGVDYIKKPFRPTIVKARIHTHITLAKQREELVLCSARDPLTNLYNLEHFRQEGERKFTRAVRQMTNLSIIIIDIDNLDEISQEYNYVTGYKVLRDVASSILQNSKRTEDFLSKYINNEFALMLEDCSAKDAKNKAYVIKKHLEKINTKSLDITLSMGICELSGAHKDFNGFLEDANEALETAKSSGGNRIVLFTDEEL